MDGKRLIEKIKLRNILSFGDKGEEITLEPLNIIIGQNASGKSNLVDVIKLLREIPISLVDFIDKNGGIKEWIWNGRKKNSNSHSFIKTIFGFEYDTIEYELEFSIDSNELKIINEKFNERLKRIPLTRKQVIAEEKTGEQDIKRRLSTIQSILQKYFEFEVEGIEYDIFSYRYHIENVKIYTDLQTNRNSDIRKPQMSNGRNGFLNEDGNNLNFVLKNLENSSKSKDRIVTNLRKFYPNIKDYTFEFIGDYLQLYLHEENLKKTVSAMRLSDGTLRYLCLLAILCHPEPPPLICIEEPETGLHPDILPTIAELMKEASQRTQLIVTTHSDILVSAFSDCPEAVLVCEKDEDGTHFKRLEKDKLKAWLEEYELGDLWLKGEIGGKRW